MAYSTPRSCNVCAFDPFWDADEYSGNHPAPNLVQLRDQIRQELQDLQRKFSIEVDQKLAAALSSDTALAIGGQTNPKTRSLQLYDPSGGGSMISSWWGSTGKIQKQNGAYKYLGMSQKEEEREPTELQLKWQELWLEEVEDGELDVYTCLGLSNCFSWTPDTRRIIAKAIAVTFLQMVVPICLLMYELSSGIQLGPAEGDIGFRLVGFTLYGYAIYSMYNGADGHCRTSLLNLMFHYDQIAVGHWLPLIMGEISNLFTAVVLVIALYSIFTTQTEPVDLIMNAIAVNFLCDCDGTFVDREMRAEAIDTFKSFTTELFKKHEAREEDPNTETVASKIVHIALWLISIAGAVGCTLFILYPKHEGGERDIAPGFAHHVVDFKVEGNGTLVPTDPNDPDLASAPQRLLSYLLN